MAPLVYLGARGKLIRQKNLKLKILCQTSFKFSILCSSLVYSTRTVIDVCCPFPFNAGFPDFLQYYLQNYV
jgi:hypothetical protein